MRDSGARPESIDHEFTSMQAGFTAMDRSALPAFNREDFRRGVDLRDIVDTFKARTVPEILRPDEYQHRVNLIKVRINPREHGERYWQWKPDSDAFSLERRIMTVAPRYGGMATLQHPVWARFGPVDRSSEDLHALAEFQNRNHRHVTFHLDPWGTFKSTEHHLSVALMEYDLRPEKLDPSCGIYSRTLFSPDEANSELLRLRDTDRHRHWLDPEVQEGCYLFSKLIRDAMNCAHLNIDEIDREEIAVWQASIGDNWREPQKFAVRLSRTVGYQITIHFQMHILWGSDVIPLSGIKGSGPSV